MPDQQQSVKIEPTFEAIFLNRETVTEPGPCDVWTFKIKSNVAGDFEVDVIDPKWERNDEVFEVTFDSATSAADGSDLDTESAGFMHPDFWWDEAKAIIEKELER